MKISIIDLKKAIQWIEVNSADIHVNVILEPHNIHIGCKDKYETQVEIKLFEDSTMLPKIRKESPL